MSRRMKDSGIEYIGQIPENWNIKKFKYCGKSRMGQTITKDELDEDGTIPVYSATQDDKIFGYLKNSTLLLHKDDLVTGARGTIGYTKIVKENVATCTQTTICTQVFNNTNSEFLKYCSNIFQDDWNPNEGSGVPQLTVEKLNNGILPFPSLPEQQKIVDKLNEEIPTIELTISETEQDIKDLEEYKKVIITEAVTKGLDSYVSMKDSGIEWIGKMPNNWQIIKIKYLCDMQSGINIVSDNIEESGQFPVYGGNGLRGYYNKYTNNGKHVLIGRQGALAGNVHLVSGKFWASDHAVVTYTYNNITNEYLYYLFIAMNLNQYAFDTAAQPGLAVNKIQNLFTIIPKDDIQQQQIVDYLDEKCAEIDDLIKEKQSLIEDLKLYKKSLIYEYVTGKKEVK